MPNSNPTPPLDSGGEPNGSKVGSELPPADKSRGKSLPDHQGIQPRSFAQVAGMGFELAGTTGALAGLGHVVDRYCGGDRSIGFAIGGFIGFGLGMYRFILKALRQIEKTNK